MADLKQLLLDALGKGASDVHLVSGLPAAYRIAKELTYVDNTALNSATIKSLLDVILSEYHRKKFDAERKLNFAFELPGVARFRANMFVARGGIGASIRMIPLRVKSMEELGLPPAVPNLLTKTSGIILVTGATGSGKSSTLASMIEHVNTKGNPVKIVTIEDPIEYVYTPVRSIIVQREVGTDVPSFDIALTEALRQDPDIIVVGEMRSRESIEMALTAAETGHLVITTLHTADPAQTVDRLVAVFAPHERDMARQQVANTLEAVLCQELVQRADKKGLCLAMELMITNPAIKHMIRDGKTEQMHDIIQTGTQIGMIPKDHFLMQLCQKGLITRETASAKMRNRELLRNVQSPLVAAPTAAPAAQPVAAKPQLPGKPFSPTGL
ncbi:MAG: PilT/PilU family type 4a pilus ATPase [Elusimicrobia bacterium]|nr:PilT/PilU family type 4a pilus ATPase [Elusimicrobiota bacterium]